MTTPKGVGTMVWVANGLSENYILYFRLRAHQQAFCMPLLYMTLWD
jgi:hypothetical protein